MCSGCGNDDDLTHGSLLAAAATRLIRCGATRDYAGGDCNSSRRALEIAPILDGLAERQTRDPRYSESIDDFIE